MDPVADLQAVTVDWDRQVFVGVGDRQWNQLLRKLVGPVVVAGSGDECIQPEGMSRGAHQVLPTGLARRVGTAGSKRRILTEELSWRDAAANLVRRDVEETLDALLSRHIQQDLGAEHVGAHKF